MTPRELRKIRQNLTPENIKTLAAKYDVSEGHIRNILLGMRKNFKILSCAIDMALKEKSKKEKVLQKVSAL